MLCIRQACKGESSSEGEGMEETGKVREDGPEGADLGRGHLVVQRGMWAVDGVSCAGWTVAEGGKLGQSGVPDRGERNEGRKKEKGWEVR